MWLLFLLLIPLAGVIILLTLENYNPRIKGEKEKEREIYQNYYDHWKETSPDIKDQIEKCEAHWHQLMEGGMNPKKADQKAKQAYYKFFSS